MERKKELKEQYKQLKPTMGLFIIKSKFSGKHHLEASLDLKSNMNRAVFQLKHGSHPQRELQGAWNQEGPEAFDILILDELNHIADATDKDYQEDLEELLQMWLQKLKQEDVAFY